jgi:hypothetical protein
MWRCCSSLTASHTARITCVILATPSARARSRLHAPSTSPPPLQPAPPVVAGGSVGVCGVCGVCGGVCARIDASWSGQPSPAASVSSAGNARPATPADPTAHTASRRPRCTATDGCHTCSIHSVSTPHQQARSSRMALGLTARCAVACAYLRTYKAHALGEAVKRRFPDAGRSPRLRVLGLKRRHLSLGL